MLFFIYNAKSIVEIKLNLKAKSEDFIYHVLYHALLTLIHRTMDIEVKLT